MFFVLLVVVFKCLVNVTSAGLLSRPPPPPLSRARPPIIVIVDHMNSSDVLLAYLLVVCLYVYILYVSDICDVCMWLTQIIV